MKLTSLNSCWSVAVSLLARRASSCWELKRYLKQRKFTDDEITAVIIRLKEYHYLDDEEFGRRMVQKYIDRYGWQYIAAKLHQRGVDDDIIQCLCMEIADDVELLSARQILDKNSKRWCNDGNHNIQKAARFLQNRGYSIAIIRKILYSIKETDLD